MIYAWSADGTDPVNHDSVMYHMSNRATQGVIFVEDNEVVNDLENARSVTFLANDVSCLTYSCINGGGGSECNVCWSECMVHCISFGSFQLL